MSDLLSGDPNGTRSLWINDTYPFDGGSIDGGWTINLISTASACLDCGDADNDHHRFTKP